MKIAELRSKSQKELQEFLAAQRELTRSLRFSISHQQHKNVKELNKVKKVVARILTVMREKKR